VAAYDIQHLICVGPPLHRRPVGLGLEDSPDCNLTWKDCFMSNDGLKVKARETSEVSQDARCMLRVSAAQGNAVGLP